MTCSEFRKLGASIHPNSATLVQQQKFLGHYRSCLSCQEFMGRMADEPNRPSKNGGPTRLSGLTTMGEAEKG